MRGVGEVRRETTTSDAGEEGFAGGERCAPNPLIESDVELIEGVGAGEEIARLMRRGKPGGVSSSISTCSRSVTRFCDGDRFCGGGCVATLARGDDVPFRSHRSLVKEEEDAEARCC